ncbi:cysteine synthase A [Idiomarina seosinensis]|uniref:cysteine synthase A n=1 Tax=Idiomarina seosinensis TaxID=281739 RepID=UPI00384BC642
MRTGQRMSDLIGQTDLLLIPSLSRLTGCEIYLKCEFQNPGGSIKDRAAKQLIEDAMKRGELESGMTVIEGTAGNTGIGLALVAKSYGMNMLAVMPNDQAPEKQRMISLHGGEVLAVDPVPFKNEHHFYHTARRIAEQRNDCWWANQFENTSNADAHYQHTAPEIWEQMQSRIDTFVSVAGTGGTIGGNSKFLKQQDKHIDVWLADPDGSGIFQFLKTGEYVSSGSSMTEGIGIMRLVENFKQATIDHAVNLPDQDLITISRYVKEQDGIVLGSSSALNVAASVAAAIKKGKGQRIVTFACDLGERSASKLYNETYLQAKNLAPEPESIADLLERYQNLGDKVIKTNWSCD